MAVDAVQTVDLGTGQDRALAPASPLLPLLAVWGAIGILALVVRVLLIDQAALTPDEAKYAFAAWQASRGQLDGSLVEFGAPLLSYLTTGLFFLLGASDA